MWQDFTWLNEPKKFSMQERLTFKTEGDTDFWRNTYYQFNRMTDRSRLTKIDSISIVLMPD